MPYKKRVLLLILFFAIVRCIIGSIVELSNDESYYWVYSQHLQWNYFDHPPLVALWIRLFTANLLLQDHVLFLRLGAIVGCALSTWFIFKCVSTIKNERAGWFAACLYNASYYAGITAGLFIMPDSSQMVFWTLSLWMLACIMKDDNKWLYWILFGIASGLCIMSKVHGIFLWTGTGLFILLKKRTWLTNPRLYVALVIALIISSPILIWNIENNFATYRFHSKRVEIAGHRSNLLHLINAFIQQVVINNPVNVIIMIAALISAFKNKLQASIFSLYNFIAFPFILAVLFMAFFRQTLPHWTGPAFVTFIPIAAVWLCGINTKSEFPLFLKFSTGFYVIFLIGCTAVINYYPGNFGNKTSTYAGKGDITLDMFGWEKAGNTFKAIYKNDIANHVMLPGTPVVCDSWWGAHEEYYFCRPSGIQMIALGPLNDIHQYAWLNKERSTKADLTNAYCIIHSDENFSIYKQYEGYYSTIDTAAVIEIKRNNITAHNFYVLRLKGWKNRELTTAQ